MGILQIDAGREMRGGQWQVLRLMEGLRAAGVETVLAARRESPLYALARERRLEVVPLGLRALRERPDLVHAHDARAHTLAAALSRAPVVVARRVAFPIRTGAASRWKYRRAAHYIAVSRFVARQLEDRGIAAEKISVVYDGVPLVPPAQPDGRILAPPPSRDKPAALYQGAGVEISFTKNLEADLKTASIFVYMSLSEGLGSGVLMAMSAGVPVIASRTGGIPEIVRHEENGLLVEPNAESLAAAVRRLASDPAWASALGRKGRQTVEERFSIDTMVRNTLDVYNRMLAC